MTFLPKWFFPQNAPAYRALFWAFCPIIQCVFTPKIPKKLIFPQIAPIITALYWLSPKKSNFLLKMRNNPVCFSPKIPKKLIFPQIVTIIQGTLLTFLPKKVIFPQNAPAYRARFWLFCPIIHRVFTPKIPKKFIFPKIVPIIQGTLLTFRPKKVIFS